MNFKEMFTEAKKRKGSQIKQIFVTSASSIYKKKKVAKLVEEEAFTDTVIFFGEKKPLGGSGKSIDIAIIGSGTSKSDPFDGYDIEKGKMLKAGTQDGPSAPMVKLYDAVVFDKDGNVTYGEVPDKSYSYWVFK